jgi:hypothetical protein
VNWLIDMIDFNDQKEIINRVSGQYLGLETLSIYTLTLDRCLILLVEGSP